MVQIVVEPPLHVVPMTEGGRAHKLTALRVSLGSDGGWRLRVNQPGVRRRHCGDSTLGPQPRVPLQNRSHEGQGADGVLCQEDAHIIDFDAPCWVLGQQSL